MADQVTDRLFLEFSMRLLGVLFLLCCWVLPVAAAEEETQTWADMAGMKEELAAQNLELRDELIAAHGSFMEALTLALAEAEAREPDNPKRELAWGRVEYLLETSFRLLDSTGEYDAFLKATQPLKVEAGEAPVEVALDGGTGAPDDWSGGLHFTDTSGRSLSVKASEHGPVLLYDAETGAALEHVEDTVATRAVESPVNAPSFIPLIKARAAWLRALALERRGKSAEGGRETAGLGLVRHWAVLGPLEGVGDTLAYGSEELEEAYAALGLSASVAGKYGPVSWAPFSSVDPLSRFFPGALFRGEGLRSALAVALVHAPENMPAVLRFGANASTTVCVNNTVARRLRFAGLPDPDQEAVEVWLRKGWNVVMLRTASSDAEWGVAVRFTLTDGSPFPGYVARPTRENLPAFLAEVRRVGALTRLDRFYQPGEAGWLDGAGILSRWLQENPDDARGNFYLGSFLVAKRMMEGPERFDRELIFRRAIQASDGDPFFTLMSARSVDSGMDGPDREENLRLVLLKSVADQGSAAALVDIGRLYLDVMRQPRRANEYAEMALSANPMSLRAGVLDYDIAEAMDWGPLARHLLEELVRRHPSAAAARLRQGRSALAGGRYRQALTEFHAILAVQADNREAVDGVVLALGMLGQTSAAVDLLLGQIERFPYAFSVRLKLAELYRILGRDKEARDTLNAALAIGPDDPEALAMLHDLDSETHAERGDGTSETAAALRQELDFSPARNQPVTGWEYLYFQVEDRLERSGAFSRNVSFALRIYTPRAARILRHLSIWLENSFESGSIVRLDVVAPNGMREPYTQQTPITKGGRELKFSLPPLRAGMTIEAEVRMRRERIAFLGDYFGHIAPLTQSAPVRLSRYMFIAPKDRRIFFRPVNGAPEAMVVSSDGGETVTRVWEMSELAPFNTEPNSPGRRELTPCVQVSSFGDWDEFAKWYWRLIGAQYHSPPELRLLANTIGEGEGVPLAKLDRAARWVSRNIGHRPWEYGPYAFRPINARSVLSRLSADGKDRTLLLCLLAREYGLEALPVLARLRQSGNETFGDGDLTLPLLDHFNHSLALVHSAPGGDVFMDASNPYRPSGVMPSQLFGSPGIAVTPDRAVKVLIPDEGTAACDWREEAEMVVDEDGSILWEEKIAGVGTAAEMLRARFQERDERDEAWNEFLVSLGGTPSTASDTFADAAEGPASASWEGRARLRRYASVEDGRVVLAVPPLPGMVSSKSGVYVYPLSLDAMVATGIRSQDLVLPHGFHIERRIEIRYPRDWKLVNPGTSMKKEYPFGTLTLDCADSDGYLALEFTVDVPGHLVKADDYPAFREMAALAGRWLYPRLVWEKP